MADVLRECLPEGRIAVAMLGTEGCRTVAVEYRSEYMAKGVRRHEARIARAPREGDGIVENRAAQHLSKHPVPYRVDMDAQFLLPRRRRGVTQRSHARCRLRPRGKNEGASTGTHLDHAIRLQFGIGIGDGDAADTEVCGKLARRGQASTCCNRAEDDFLPNPFADLAIQRQRAFRMDGERHGNLLTMESEAVM